MALSLISAGEDGFRRISLEDLRVLQAEQFAHDEANHREIARLPVQRRLTHMALHFSKYAGRLFESESDDRRTLVDVFIIALSSANTLGLYLQPLASDDVSESADIRQRFVGGLVVEAGRMAAACEKLDHLEDFPFRHVLSVAVQNIGQIAQAYAAGSGWDLTKMVRDRLAGVRQKAFNPSR